MCDPLLFVFGLKKASILTDTDFWFGGTVGKKIKKCVADACRKRRYFRDPSVFRPSEPPSNKFWRWFGVFGSLPSAFWGRPIHYFGHFWWFSPFQWPPRTAPKVWINFYHFIRPNSIIGSCFILVWYMSGVIWKVKSHVRKSECFWNWEIQSVGSLVTVFANFKTTHFFEHEIWPFKWLQTCTKPI